MISTELRAAGHFAEFEREILREMHPRRLAQARQNAVDWS